MSEAKYRLLQYSLAKVVGFLIIFRNLKEEYFVCIIYKYIICIPVCFLVLSNVYLCTYRYQYTA